MFTRQMHCKMNWGLKLEFLWTLSIFVENISIHSHMLPFIAGEGDQGQGLAHQFAGEDDEQNKHVLRELMTL